MRGFLFANDLSGIRGNHCCEDVASGREGGEDGGERHWHALYRADPRKGEAITCNDPT